MASRATATEIRRVLAAFDAHGVLLRADTRLPSVATLVARGPIRGSWWAHDRAHAIYDACERLNHNSDVALPRLIAGKVTYVHRRFWPALYAVGSAHDAWQTASLRPAVARLLSVVEERGELSMRDVPWMGGDRRDAPTECARQLERLLLAYGEEHHTETGAHAKSLESWDHWARRVKCRKRIALAVARTQLESAVASACKVDDVSALLPWLKKRRNVRPSHPRR